MAESQDFLPGTLDVLVLRTLAGGAMHGYGVTAQLRQRVEGAFPIQDAALYQSFRRLEKRGWIESDWRVTENNRRARYYTLTARGLAELGAASSAWARYAAAVANVLNPGLESGQ